MTNEQLISRHLIIKTVEVKLDLAYLIYLKEIGELNKN